MVIRRPQTVRGATLPYPETGTGIRSRKVDPSIESLKINVLSLISCDPVWL